MEELTNAGCKCPTCGRQCDIVINSGENKTITKWMIANFLIHKRAGKMYLHRDDEDNFVFEREISY